MSARHSKTLSLASIPWLIICLALPGLAIKYPFTRLVAFGDQYADNGNGTYAHGLDPNNLFKRYTWTDGPVAPTYLAQLLNVPLMDYAWGGAYGNGLAGATLDNNYTPAAVYWNNTIVDPPTMQLVPSVTEQIWDNYTANGAPSDINTTLHFIWAGQNDMRKHTNWYQDNSFIVPSNPRNQQFYGNYTYYLQTQAEYLIQQGSPAVIVVNLLPYQTTPANNYLFCKGLGNVCSKKWGNVIQGANNALQAGLAASDYADQIIYYDLYGFMMQVMANKDSYGYTQPLPNFCNGNSSEPEWSWPICSKNPWASARPFFWFTLCQPETSMHQFIAKDILKTVTAFLRKNSK